jgi:hypothetical protein
MNVDTKPRRARVLRAADVMPPFDKNVAPAKGAGAAEQGGSVPAEPSKSGGVGLLNETTQEAAPSSGGPAEIPTYDLAENVLAEQRRVASRRRRAPGRGENEPVARVGHVRPPGVTADLPSVDLLALQRIVAEIVAKDINRLCRRPNR